MNFIKFVEKVKQMLESSMREDIKITVTSVQKNNGVKLDGLCIMEPEKNISPTIYLNDYYEKYVEGMSLGEIADEVMGIYEKSKIEKSVDVNFFTDFEKAKSKIVYKLINYKKNEDLLACIPYVQYLDLAITFYCILVNEKIGNAVIQINNAHLEMWQVSLEEIYDVAFENTPKLLPYELLSMEQVVKNMFSEEEDLTEMEQIFDFENENAMYVLSNTSKLNGAAAILYPDILKDFAKSCGCDLYILPSSIHEVILVPAKGKGDIEGLNEMVQDVNATQVEPEEVLSDHVYLFDQKSAQVSSAPMEV